MKKLLCLALCITGIAVFAQETKNVSVHMQLCYETLEAAQFEKQLKDSAAQLLSAQMQANPALIPYRPELEAFYAKCLNYNEIKDDIAKIYSQLYTPEELRQLIAFYKSPIGQTFLKKNPELTVKFSMLTEKIIAKNAPELVKAIQAKTKQLQQKK